MLPVAPIRRWYCTACGNEINARRPSRPFILMAGVAGAVLITFAGVMILLEGRERETAVGCLVFGPLLAAGQIYAIRKGEHKNFAAATKAVPPLRADHCPYCEAPVFTTGTPRCHACKVDIITG